jgi:hypothetical protein
MVTVGTAFAWIMTMTTAGGMASAIQGVLDDEELDERGGCSFVSMEWMPFNRRNMIGRGLDHFVPDPGDDVIPAREARILTRRNPCASSQT